MRTFQVIFKPLTIYLLQKIATSCCLENTGTFASSTTSSEDCVVLFMCPCFSKAKKWSMESKSNVYSRHFSHRSGGTWQKYNSFFCASTTIL